MDVGKENNLARKIIEAEYLKNAHVLSIKDGDVIVVNTDRPTTIEFISMVRETMKDIFPKNKTIILEEGVQVGIMRQSDE